MKKVSLCIILLSYVGIQAQIEYHYDNYGNRTQRKLQICNNCPETERQVTAEEEKKKEEVASALGLSVFPNPAQDKVQVVINNLNAQQEVIVLLIDEQGKSLVNQKTQDAQNQVDMSPYKPGIYFIKVIVDKEVLIYKVLKL